MVSKAKEHPQIIINIITIIIFLITGWGFLSSIDVEIRESIDKIKDDIEETINKGFNKIHNRIDKIDQRVTNNREDIIILKNKKK